LIPFSFLNLSIFYPTILATPYDFFLIFIFFVLLCSFLELYLKKHLTKFRNRIIIYIIPFWNYMIIFGKEKDYGKYS